MNGYQMLLEYFDCCWFDGCCSSKFWHDRLLHTGVCQTHNIQTSFDYCYILFSLNITITFRVHCYKEKRIALPLTEWASKIEHCQGKLPENMVKLCLWLGYTSAGLKETNGEQAQKLGSLRKTDKFEWI